MPRCGCAEDQCSCVIVAGANISIEGSGRRNNPLVISSTAQIVDESGTPAPADGRFVGEIIAYAGANPPNDDWRATDGSALSRAVYSTLFAVTGTAYGAGDGENTFNLPNIGGRMLLGADGPNPRGGTGGTDEVTLEAANLPAHSHTINHGHGSTSTNGRHQHGIDRSAAPGGSNSNVPQGTTTTTSVAAVGAIREDGEHSHTVTAHAGSSGSVGSGTPVPILPPYVAMPHYIKVR